MKIAEAADVLHVYLDRGAKLNAMDRCAWESLAKAIGTADASPHIRCLVIHGDTRAFCAGNDINAMVEAQAKDDVLHYFLQGMLPTFEMMARSRVPIISVVEGIAFGGGLEILCFSDLVIATQSSSFALPETGIGVWATVYLAACSTASSRRTGAKLALTGQRIDAAESLQLGISTHVCEEEDLDTVLTDVLDGIRATKPEATTRTKAWLNRDLIAIGLPRCREALTELCDETLTQPEYHNAMTAYFAARKLRSTTANGVSA